MKSSVTYSWLPGLLGNHESFDIYDDNATWGSRNWNASWGNMEDVSGTDPNPRPTTKFGAV